MTAEEEKARLFDEAQAAVMRIQGQQSPLPSAGMSGAALYSDAMSAINKPLVNGRPSASSSALQSAADEKAVLQRYYEAQNAVLQNHTAHYGTLPEGTDPTIPLSAYTPPPSGSTAGPARISPPIPSSPPPFAASPSHPMDALSALTEKERMRRHYEAQDASAASNPPLAPPRLTAPVASGARLSAFGPTTTFGSPPPFPPPTLPTQPLDAFSEKEMLKRRYEAQDAAALGPAPPGTPPRSSTLMSNGSRSRPPPTPPTLAGLPGTPGIGRPPTAAEEKARLKALYEAEDRGSQMFKQPYPSPPPSERQEHSSDERQVTPPYAARSFVAPPPPPPLAPKPPKEYIQETQEEDLRTHAKLQAIDLRGPAVLDTLEADIIPSKRIDNYRAAAVTGPPPLSPSSEYSPEPSPSSLVSSYPTPGPPPPLPPPPPPLVIE